MTVSIPRTGTTDFWTLVGPDFAGKSTVLGTLSDQHGWRVVSYDDRYLASYPLISQLRRQWINDAFVWSGERYSPELVLSVLHPIVLHLRDELTRAAGQQRVIVDSYYYKLLAKCQLLGVAHGPIFDYWRSFPQPRGVLYLDVAPEVSWARSDQGAALNAFERYGRSADGASFFRLQADLRAAVLTEVGAIPLQIIDGTPQPDTVVEQVLAALELATAKPAALR
jgi:thymidylate kinase